MILQNISEGFCSTQRKRNLDVNPESAEKKALFYLPYTFETRLKGNYKTQNLGLGLPDWSLT